ncbi:hypothetical protein [Pseudomonas sp. TWR1-1-4]|uniref:hypothetical protein n=1 Tax=Pseudomonas sp. TWR1-1-4 TaxID=2804604 RepID=UPI003CE6FE8C
MSIAIFQLIVTTSIFVSSRFGSRVLLLACIAWTLFTLAFVYTSPLTALQLLTIWGSYWLCSSATPTTEKEPSTQLEKISEYAASINDKLTVRQFVMQAVRPLNVAIHQERLVIETSLESAKNQLMINKDFAQKGAEYQALFEESHARFSALLKPSSTEAKSLVMLPDFEGIAVPDCERSALALNEEIRYLREERTKYLDCVRKTVLTDAQLLDLFEKRLRNHNAAVVWQKEFCPSVGKPSDGSNHPNRRKTFGQLLTALQSPPLPKD